MNDRNPDDSYAYALANNGLNTSKDVSTKTAST